MTSGNGAAHAGQTTTQPNQNLSMSADGLDALRRHEGVVQRYYNDAAGNCTYGVGTLVHTGRCTETEMGTPVTDEQINQSLQTRTENAARTVRNGVRNKPLTQQQFDALVSFVYNVGATGARNVLHTVNQGRLNAAANQIEQFVHITVRDAQGNVTHPVALGLVSRRREEAAPFRTAPR
jgi:lysozyme